MMGVIRDLLIFNKLKIGFVIIFFSILSSNLYSKENSIIEIILSSDNSIYEQSLFGIQSVIDREVKITYLDIISSESSSLEAYFRDLESTAIPIVITIGPQATKAAKEYLLKTPVVFSMVNNPKTLGLGQKNLCGVSMDITVEEFFQTLNDIDPTIQNVVGFYSNEDSSYIAKEGTYSDIKFKLLYNAIQVNPEEFTKQLNSLDDSIDAFYMISDPLYNQTRFEELSQYAKKKSIILMTAFPTLVKLGSTFGISPDYSKIGVETGLMANRILAKESNCEEERVILPSQSSFYINEEYAKDSNIHLPPAIIERAKTTRLFSAGITLLNEDKLKPAKVVFDAILKNDPTNKTAQTYQSLVIEKLTGTRTRELLRSAKQFYEEKRYANSRSEYQKVLAINPNDEEAKEGYKISILAQSEQERIKGNQYQSSGKPFDAIREYLASLRTLSNNTKAQADLQNVRRIESSKIPGYLNTGIKEYNERNYDKSIAIFEDILLIDPNEKSAKEYLRLSYKKKEAIEILKKKLNR